MINEFIQEEAKKKTEGRNEKLLIIFNVSNRPR